MTSICMSNSLGAAQSRYFCIDFAAARAESISPASMFAEHKKIPDMATMIRQIWIVRYQGAEIDILFYLKGH